MFRTKGQSAMNFTDEVMWAGGVGGWYFSVSHAIKGAHFLCTIHSQFKEGFVCYVEDQCSCISCQVSEVTNALIP